VDREIERAAIEFFQDLELWISEVTDESCTGDVRGIFYSAYRRALQEANVKDFLLASPL